MRLADLGLWADEERRIRDCLVSALQEMIVQEISKPEDDEKTISGKLRPLIVKFRKDKKLLSTFHAEASVFAHFTSADPFGHPDLQFSFIDTGRNQWDYDVECKLVRVKRPVGGHDYCKYYVHQGVVDRFANRKYCPNLRSGTMVGYVQEGEFNELLLTINQQNVKKKASPIKSLDRWKDKGVSWLGQHLIRTDSSDFFLMHLWADLRRR